MIYSCYFEPTNTLNGNPIFRCGCHTFGTREDTPAEEGKSIAADTHLAELGVKVQEASGYLHVLFYEKRECLAAPSFSFYLCVIPLLLSF